MFGRFGFLSLVVSYLNVINCIGLYRNNIIQNFNFASNRSLKFKCLIDHSFDFFFTPIFIDDEIKTRFVLIALYCYMLIFPFFIIVGPSFFCCQLLKACFRLRLIYIIKLVSFSHNSWSFFPAFFLKKKLVHQRYMLINVRLGSLWLFSFNLYIIKMGEVLSVSFSSIIGLENEIRFCHFQY